MNENNIIPFPFLKSTAFAYYSLSKYLVCLEILDYNQRRYKHKTLFGRKKIKKRLI